LPSNLTTYTTTVTLPHGKYYWRLLVTGQPTIPTSLVQSFTISPNKPTKPTLSATPVVTNDTTPTFTWSASTSPQAADVLGYELELSTSSTFSPLVGGAPIAIPGIATTSYTWAPELPASAGQVYYARVRAITNLNVY